MSNQQSESELIPYQSALPNVRSALVLAPHADDEVFGCGGTLSLLAQAGARLSTVIVTDSEFGAGFQEDLPPIEVRRSESRVAATILGYPEPGFWKLPDRRVVYGPALIDRIVQAAQAAGAETILAPSPAEIHPDHRALSLATAEAVRRLGAGTRALFYEVSAPLRPNLLVDISAVVARKGEAMRAFTSQLATRRYDRFIEGLNHFRAYTLDPSVTAAEAFLAVTAEELEHGAPELMSHLNGPVERAPAPRGGGPRVSVLIRSMDRPCLASALTSVAAQTFGDIEAVVVDAGGQHRALPERWNGIATRLVGTGRPMTRPAAANYALTQARGDWLLFLDDDDLLLPDHIGRLVNAATASGPACAAYAGVRIVDDQGKELAVHDDPAAATRLWSTNVLPIHAVLFPRKVVLEGAQFDEQLPIYEDWDFWLQLTAHVRFIHVPGVSAVYRSALGTSEVTDPSRAAARELARLRVLARWLPRMSPSTFDTLLALENKRVDEEYQRARRAEDLAASLRKEIDLLRNRLRRPDGN